MCSRDSKEAGLGGLEELRRIEGAPTTLRTLTLSPPSLWDPTASSCHTPHDLRALRSCPFIALGPKLGPLSPEAGSWPSCP